jgi:hypothetical protein
LFRHVHGFTCQTKFSILLPCASLFDTVYDQSNV